MIKKVLRMGHPKLQTPAQPITTFDTEQLHQLIADLFETMKATGGVGLAAPQIGVCLQVIVFGFTKSTRYPDAKPIPDTVLINPRYTPINDEQVDYMEGCLSIPGMRGLVRRYRNIHYEGFDPYGNRLEGDVHDFHARVLQHEIDHLNGTLNIERLASLKYFGFEPEIIETMRNCVLQP